MSHFTSIRTRLANKGYLKAALADLHLLVEEGALDIRDFSGQRVPVELRVAVDRGAHQIGFRRAGDAYELVADWYGIKQVDRRTFPSRLAQRYAYHAARAELGAQGFEVAGEETRADGTIHITVRRMT